LVLTGYAPTVIVTEDQFVNVPLGTLILTGYAPTIAVSDNQNIEVPLGTLVLTGHVPTVEVTEDQFVNVPLGTVVLTGYAPTVEVTANVTIVTPLGVLVLTGYAPTVFASNHQEIIVPLGTLGLTGYAPTITITANIKVPTGIIILTGHAPTVVVTDIIIPLMLQKLQSTGVAPSYVSARAGGDEFENDGLTWLLIRNGAVEVSVTFATYKYIDDQHFSSVPLKVSDRIVVIPANNERYIGIFPKDLYNDPNGSVQMTYDKIDNVTVAAFTYQI
jgi:hypothetical protein